MAEADAKAAQCSNRSRWARPLLPPPPALLLLLLALAGSSSRLTPVASWHTSCAILAARPGPPLPSAASRPRQAAAACSSAQACNASPPLMTTLPPPSMPSKQPRSTVDNSSRDWHAQSCVLQLLLLSCAPCIMSATRCCRRCTMLGCWLALAVCTRITCTASWWARAQSCWNWLYWDGTGSASKRAASAPACSSVSGCGRL
jgi:hypothetical protein